MEALLVPPAPTLCDGICRGRNHWRRYRPSYIPEPCSALSSTVILLCFEKIRVLGRSASAVDQKTH